MNLKLLKRNRIYNGRVFSVIADVVQYPSGRATIREVARHPGGAVALAMFPDRRIVMIRQHRYPHGKFVWELPAGKLEHGERPLHCAQRELAEETGYVAKKWKKLFSILTTPGFCDEILHIFLATGLSISPKGRQLEEGEQTMSVKVIPLSRALAMIDRGLIVDAKTICGILQAHRLLSTI